MQLAQPWAVQLKERAKWDAWNKLKGTSTDAAMQKYIDVVTRLVGKYGLAEGAQGSS